jgi:hypothetical protein
MTAREYAFEILRNYPSERRFTIMRPMEKSLMDRLMEAVFGKR